MSPLPIGCRLNSQERDRNAVSKDLAERGLGLQSRTEPSGDSNAALQEGGGVLPLAVAGTQRSILPRLPLWAFPWCLPAVAATRDRRHVQAIPPDGLPERPGDRATAQSLASYGHADHIDGQSQPEHDRERAS